MTDLVVRLTPQVTKATACQRMEKIVRLKITLAQRSSHSINNVLQMSTKAKKIRLIVKKTVTRLLKDQC